MTPYILALRAITGTVLGRIINIVGGVIGGILAIFWILMLIASITLSEWWLLLLIILIPVSILFVTFYYILHSLSNKLCPRKLSKEEKGSIHKFSGKVLGIIEKAKTPLPLVGFMIAKDTLRQRESTFIKEVIEESSSLKQDFNEIKLLFDPSRPDMLK